MNVRSDPGGPIERSCAHEPQLGSSVLAEDRHLAGWTTEDPLRAAVVAWDLDRLRIPSDQLHAACLDDQIDHKGASSLALTVQAMTAMDEERIGLKSVPNRAAGTAAFTKRAHGVFLEYTGIQFRR